MGDKRKQRARTEVLRDARLARGKVRARQGSRLTMFASESAPTLPREGAEQRSSAIAYKSVACAASSGSSACPAQSIPGFGKLFFEKEITVSTLNASRSSSRVLLTRRTCLCFQRVDMSGRQGATGRDFFLSFGGHMGNLWTFLAYGEHLGRNLCAFSTWTCRDDKGLNKLLLRQNDLSSRCLNLNSWVGGPLRGVCFAVLCLRL